MKTENIFNDLKLGDLVNFITKDYIDTLSEIEIESDKSTYIIKQSKNNNVPPTMVVTELASLESHTNKLFDEKSGQRIKDEVQVKCMWYSRINKKEFIQERWFNSKVLQTIEAVEFDPSEEFELNNIVALRTSLAAGTETKEIIRTQQRLSEIKKDNIVYKFETDTSPFFPPKMIITGIGKKNGENGTYSVRTGKKIKSISEREVKCMWYDASSGKFSERFFPIESLLLIHDSESPRLIELVEEYLEEAQLPMETNQLQAPESVFPEPGSPSQISVANSNADSSTENI